MSNIDHMLASIIGKDKEAFSSAFADEMRERLATSIIDKNLNISQDLLTDEEEMDSEEQEEIEESGVVKKGKPIPMDLLYPKGHKHEGEIVGGKKKVVKKKVAKKVSKEKESSTTSRMPGILPYTQAQWDAHLKKNESAEPLEELRGAKFFPSGYTFKTTKSAKEFVVALKHMGIKKNNISQKGKTISVNLVGGRHHDTLVMIKNLAKDMKASITESNIIDTIREAYSSEFGASYTLKDSQMIHILPEDADNIIQIHDTLNAENQAVLRDMLSETEKSYQKVLNFCNKKVR
jgi:hypothetical protein